MVQSLVRPLEGAWKLETTRKYKVAFLFMGQILSLWEESLGDLGQALRGGWVVRVRTQGRVCPCHTGIDSGMGGVRTLHTLLMKQIFKGAHTRKETDPVTSELNSECWRIVPKLQISQGDRITFKR